MAIGTQPASLLTSDGLRLDGDITVPVAAPIAAAVVCHPHPRYGGDRTNAVVGSVVRALAEVGVVALRFDFRGVNRSEGRHGEGGGQGGGEGVGERLDVVAAIEHLAGFEEAAGVPLWAVGYSFGAAVVLGVDDARLAGWVAIAPPLAMMPIDGRVPADPRPKHVLVPGHDQFSPPATTQPIVATWANTSPTVLPSADHFLAGHLADVSRLVAAAIIG